MTENQRRKFLKLVGASLVGVAGMSIVGCTPLRTQDAAEPSLPQYDTSPITDIRREALAERLKKLAESEPPTDLAWGAMCYEMGIPFYRQVACPDCGEKMCEGEKDEILRAYNVPLKRIQDLGLDATLIIPEHCPTCGLGMGECGLYRWEQSELRKSSDDWKQRNFHLEIKYPDDPDFVRVELDEAHDLELMSLFLQGKDRWQGERTEEYALKDKVDRLKELFGVKE